MGFLFSGIYEARFRRLILNMLGTNGDTCWEHVLYVLCSLYLWLAVIRYRICHIDDHGVWLVDGPWQYRNLVQLLEYL